MGCFARASAALPAGIKPAMRTRTTAWKGALTSTGDHNVCRIVVEAATMGNATTLEFALLGVSKSDMDPRATKHAMKLV